MNGNVQPRLLHRDVLIVVGLVGAHHVEHRAHLAPGDKIVIGQLRCSGACCESGRILHELPDLLLECHLLEQRIHTRVDFLRGELRIWRRAGLRGHGYSDGAGKQKKHRSEVQWTIGRNFHNQP